MTQNTGETTAGDRCYKLAVVCVLLVCFLVLIAIIVLGIKYSILTAEKEELLTRYNAVIPERDECQSSYRELTLEKDYLNETNKNLTIIKEELQSTIAKLQSKLDDIETQENQKWKCFGPSIYYISEMKNWYESKLDCEKRGGHLVIINSWSEEDFINNELGKGQAWIGLSDIETEGTWKWVDNKSLNTGYWNYNEPNNADGEDCAEVFEPVGERSWNDKKCTRKSSWICEKKAV